RDVPGRLRLQLLLASRQPSRARTRRARMEVARAAPRDGGRAHRSPLDDARVASLPGAPAGLGAPEAPGPTAQHRATATLGGGLVNHGQLRRYPAPPAGVKSQVEERSSNKMRSLRATHANSGRVPRTPCMLNLSPRGARRASVADLLIATLRVSAGLLGTMG